MIVRMPVVRWKMLLVAAITLFLLSVLAAPLVLASTRAYQGSVTINDGPAVNGTEVTVTVNGKEGTCASATTSGGRYVLYITDNGGSCPDPDSTPILNFFVNNISVGSVEFNPVGGVQPVDLVVNQAGESLSGRAMVAGVSAISGTVLAVIVPGAAAPCITTQVGGFGEYQIIVPPATSSTANCPRTGQQIMFTLNGLAATERISFEPSRSIRLDLNAQAAGHTISGVALVGGNPAVNAPVQAYIDRTVCGSTTSDEQGKFNLTVTADIQQTGCGTTGSLVVFNIGTQRASQSLSFQSGGATQGFIVSVAPLTCAYANANPPDGAVVSETRPRISINVTCVSPPGAITMSLDTMPVSPIVSVSGNTRTISYTSPDQLSLGFHSVTVGVAAAEPLHWTFLIGETDAVGVWVDRPPSTQGGARTCPPAGQWRLLYWNGPSDVSMEIAARSCADAQVYWLNRRGKWFGYSKAAPGASDNWDTTTGEANFVRGQDNQ